MSTPRQITILSPLPNPNSTSLHWLITSPFFPPPTVTITSTIQCLSSPNSPNLQSESLSLRSLIPRGFHVIGALLSAENNSDSRQLATRAIEITRELRELLYGDAEGNLGNVEVIGGVVSGDGVRFFGSEGEGELEVVYEEKEKAERFVWDRGCLVTCRVDLSLPVYVNVSKPEDALQRYENAHKGLVAMFKDPQLTYILESLKGSSNKSPRAVVIRGSELDFETEISNVKILADNANQSDRKSLRCSYFCSESKNLPSDINAENADTIQATVLLNKSAKSQESAAPVVEYYPASEEATLMVVEYKLEVVCYAVRDLPLTYAISKLIIPALVDQLTTLKNIVLPSFLSQHPQLRPYHFCPPGFLHPVTAIYELNYGETEQKQVEARRLLHLRLGLPSDRPLLRIANALIFSPSSSNEKLLAKKGYPLLKDVHSSIPSSGVSGGLMSLVQGSYEYHHYLQGGFDDSGWGCAYRSLQTIISWFRLQHYSSIDVPTHREIQQALVEIGDKDPSFIGSREWIGAIELSYVLDKLLGVTCKVINVRSGAELPEKCRELALHFENQGTPIMIGGGVLAYTLLGVDYNDASGDCAFLILDPHYTGGEDLKKIVNGGWCGWKKAVDSKGKSFFLADRFYNLLLPQRPNMV